MRATNAPSCQRPLTPILFLVRSLAGNALCGIYPSDIEYPSGTYTTEGIVAICDVLKLNSSLTSLSYVLHTLNFSPKCQDPLTSCRVLRAQSLEQRARARGGKARG